MTTKAEKELTDAEKKIETAVEGAPKKVKKQAKAIQDNLENVKTSIEFINIEKKKLDKALQAATTIKKELESDEEAAQYLERTERFHAVESERIANEIIAHDDAITKYLKLIEEKILILRKKLDISHSYLLKVVKEVDAVKDTVKKLREDVVKEVRKSMELRATTHKIKIKYKGKQ